MAEVRADSHQSSRDAGHSDDLVGESSTTDFPSAAATSATLGSFLLEAVADLLPVGVFSVAVYDRLSGRGRKTAGDDGEVTAQRS